MLELTNNKKNSQVSIVIPIYNVEKYLKRCLDSVIKQTYKNIEIIAVSDGSPDNSEQIVKEYANKDSRIKLIVIKHRGTSAAVAAGVKAANGEYIAFVDPDDYIGEDFIANFMAEIEDCDLVSMGHYLCSSSDISEIKADIKTSQYFTDKDISLLKDDLNFERKLFTNYRWDKLCRKQLIDNFIVIYGELKLSISEDWYFLQLMLNYLKKYKVSSKINTYYYCFNPNSISYTVKSIDDYCINVEKFKIADKVIDKYSKDESCFDGHMAYALAMNYINQYVRWLNKKEACIAIKNILKNTDFISSLLAVRKYYRGKLSKKKYIKFNVWCVIYKLRLSKVTYNIVKRRFKNLIFSIK